MIDIRVDLGNAPQVLAAMSDPKMGVLAAKAAAEAYVDEMLDWIEAGKGFTSRTGQLEQSIGWRPLADGAEVYANKEYAGFVEFGTPPHVIEPGPDRKALKFPVAGGGFGYARRVNHPGSKPHPYFFADTRNRENVMQQRALSVLAARMERA